MVDGSHLNKAEAQRSRDDLDPGAFWGPLAFTHVLLQIRVGRGIDPGLLPGALRRRDLVDLSVQSVKTPSVP